MRLLVCGGRDYADGQRVLTEIGRLDPTLIIHGGARGADSLAGSAALLLDLPVMVFTANWAAYGRGAGHVRNAKMLAEGKPDHVLAFPGGRGTADMVRRARKAGVPVTEVER